MSRRTKTFRIYIYILVLTCRLHRQSKRDDSIQRPFPSSSFHRKYFVTVLSQVALAAPGRSCRWHPWPAKLDQPGHSRGPARPFQGTSQAIHWAMQGGQPGQSRAWQGLAGLSRGAARSVKGAHGTQGYQPGHSRGPAQPGKGLAGPVRVV